MISILSFRKKGYTPIIAAVILLLLISGFAQRRYNANSSWRSSSSTPPSAYSTADADGDSSKPTHNEHAAFSIPAPEASPEPIPMPKANERELVVAAMKGSNMDWLDEFFPKAVANVYRVDDWFAELTVPKNKGREAMVFLTYIIDRYDDLPEVGVFIHDKRYQWHNDNPYYDAVIMLEDLKDEYVKEVGYANLRCVWMWGCPNELEPARYYRDRPDDKDHPTAMEFPGNFMQLFPNTTIPEIVGIPCCSQFALSRERIRERPKSDYVRYRKWLLDTELIDATSGRIMEYSFHMMFGMPAQNCPDPRHCYCKTYGYCNMTDADLKAQWEWRGETLPEGWPDGVTVKKRPTDP